MATAAGTFWLDDRNWADVMRHVLRGPVRAGLDGGRCWCDRGGLTVATGSSIVMTNVDRVSAPVVRSRRRGALREPRTTTSRSSTPISTEPVDIEDKENNEPNASGWLVDERLERTRSRFGVREGARSDRAHRTFSGNSTLQRSSNDPLNSRHSLESHFLSNATMTLHCTIVLGPSSSAPLPAISNPSPSRAPGVSRPSGGTSLHIYPAPNSPSDGPDTERISDEGSPLPNALDERPDGEKVHSPTLKLGSVRGLKDEGPSETEFKRKGERFQDTQEDEAAVEVISVPLLNNEDGYAGSHFTLFPDKQEAFDPEEAFEDAEEDESQNEDLVRLDAAVDRSSLPRLPTSKDGLCPDVKEALQRAISPLTLG